MLFHDRKMSSKKNYHWLMSPDLFFSEKDLVCLPVCDVRERKRVRVCLLITHLGQIKTNAWCIHVCLCCLLIFGANSQQYHCLPLVHIHFNIFMVFCYCYSWWCCCCFFIFVVLSILSMA